MSRIHHLALQQASKLKWRYFSLGLLSVFNLSRSTVELYSSEVAQFLKDSQDLAKLLGLDLDAALTTLMRWRRAGQVALILVLGGLLASVAFFRA